MAAPTDAARPTTAGTGTTFNINLPSVVSGDIMICIATINGTIMGTTPVGFTSLHSASVDGTFLYTYVGYRMCDGTEGATTNAAANISSKYTAIVWKITGGDTSFTPIISTKATASSTAVNPTAASTGSALDFLWLFVATTNNQPTMPPTSPPSGYGTTVGVQSGGTGGASSKDCCFGASKQATAVTSEDPGSWTISTSSVWGAWTVGVAASSAPPTGPSDYRSGRYRRADRFLVSR